jgi:hypothetical protein
LAKLELCRILQAFLRDLVAIALVVLIRHAPGKWFVSEKASDWNWLVNKSMTSSERKNNQKAI